VECAIASWKAEVAIYAGMDLPQLLFFQDPLRAQSISRHFALSIKAASANFLVVAAALTVENKAVARRREDGMLAVG